MIIFCVQGGILFCACSPLKLTRERKINSVEVPGLDMVVLKKIVLEFIAQKKIRISREMDIKLLYEKRRILNLSFEAAAELWDR